MKKKEKKQLFVEWEQFFLSHKPKFLIITSIINRVLKRPERKWQLKPAKIDFIGYKENCRRQINSALDN